MESTNWMVDEIQSQTVVSQSDRVMHYSWIVVVFSWLSHRKRDHKCRNILNSLNVALFSPADATYVCCDLQVVDHLPLQCCNKVQSLRKPYLTRLLLLYITQTRTHPALSSMVPPFSLETKPYSGREHGYDWFGMVRFSLAWVGSLCSGKIPWAFTSSPNRLKCNVIGIMTAANIYKIAAIYHLQCWHFVDWVSKMTIYHFTKWCSFVP